MTEKAPKRVVVLSTSEYESGAVHQVYGPDCECRYLVAETFGPGEPRFMMVVADADSPLDGNWAPAVDPFMAAVIGLAVLGNQPTLVDFLTESGMEVIAPN